MDSSYIQIYILACVLASAYVCADDDVPSACAYDMPDGELRYRCNVTGTRFIVHAAKNTYVNIQCVTGNLTADLMPSLPLSNGTLSSVTLRSCPPLELKRLLSRVGAREVDRLLVNDQRGVLRVGNVEGLGIRSLSMVNATYQPSVPYDIIASVTSLSSFRLQGASVSLPPAPHLPLTMLELSGDGIQELRPGVFRKMENLTELHLWGNRIEVVKPGAFDGLSRLQTLDLSRNPLGALAPGALRGAPNLTRLWVNAATLHTVHAGALDDTPLLAEIRLNLGKSPLTLEDGSLSNLQHLKSISLKKTPLNALPKELFANSRAIETLNMTECNLTDLPASLFRDQRNLTTLLLNKNRISVLPLGLFDNLIKLELLDLSDNAIRDLQENIFAGLSSLLTLKLERNQLATVSERSFTGLLRLQTLNMSRNQLTFKLANQGDAKFSHQREEVHRSPLVGLTEMRQLDLSGNAIEVVFDDWRMSLYRLQYIDLSSNKIRVLRKKDLEFLPIQIEVDLRHNLISTIEVSDKLRSTTTLLLGHNPYKCDCLMFPLLNYIRTHKTALNFNSASCSTPQYLQNVSITSVALTSLICPIYNCPNNCTCGLESAVSSLFFDCTAAPITYLKPEEYNVTTMKLKLHSLNNNSLPIIPSEVVSLNLSAIGLTRAPSLPMTLKEVDLSENQLATIPQAISNLKATLYIAGNPIQCSCENKDDIEALLKRGDGIADGDQVSCVNGGPLLSVIPSNLCEVWWSGAVGGFFAAFGITMAVVATFVYNYSEEIKRFIYKQGWNLFIYEEEVDGRKTDVLLSYGDDEEKFVVQQFVPEIEKRGYTVKARYKDWDIGVFIPDRVVETVDESRRVIVIWTKDYSSSVSCMEWKAAQLAQMGQKRKRLLVVVKDEGEAESLKGLKVKCLKWDHSSFWEQLEKELPKRRKEGEKKVLSQATLNVLMTAEGKVAFARNKV